MNKSRIIISLLLVILMLASVIPFATTADETETTDTPAVKDEKLPEQFSLVGTVHLPPISNQGEIGSCASQSITYTQMTNAVSRYIHSIDPDTDWNPSSGDPKYLMSSKFTYDFSGSGTAWVYDILVDHGCATMDYCAFENNKYGGYSIWKNLAAKLPRLDSTRWTVQKDEMLNALQYRLNNYEQVWARDIDAYVDGQLCLTTTENGKAFLDKIKSALVAGNVVVTGGISGGWKYDKIKRKSGSAKINDWALTYTLKGAGGHQLAIVGYDDNVIYDFAGGQMKGAFLVANSWAESWMNKGYIWVMYDALNGKSEFAEFDESHPGERIPTMDQYVFTYWDKDIEIGLPELMVEVEVSCVNRENVAVYLTRHTDKNYDTLIPKMFYYGKIGGRNYHPKHDITEGFTFDGNVVKAKTKAATAIFTLSYSNLIKSIPEGKTFDDYRWGVNVYSADKEAVTVKSITLINNQKQVISKIDIPEGGIEFASQSSTAESQKFIFDYVNPTISANESDAFSIEYTTAPAKYLGIGNEISFKVNPSEGKQIVSVSVDGNKIEAVDGIYTAPISENTNIQVETEDISTAPEETLTPAGTSTATTEPTTKNNDGIIIVIVIIAVALVAVVAVVVVCVTVKKKKG